MRRRSPHYDFDKGCAELLMYLTRHIEIDISEDYVAADGFCLGTWIRDVRMEWIEGNLSEKEVEKLHRLGLAKVMDEQTWESMYRLAGEYYDRHGNCDVPINYRTEDGMLLGAWVDKQRRLLLANAAIIREQADRLSQIGIRRNENGDKTI